mmetsp:Transcript_6043/g.19750  ORF Transcript_6043/g.19750 Transcript_6043/m.19750 type:complete len:101 (-) Transcript_6043:2080-2382(-)
MSGRLLRGTVLSAGKALKTVKVAVPRHAGTGKYGKSIVLHSKLLVHDEEQIARVGDTVSLRQSRPHSKLKRHEIVSVERQDPAQQFLRDHPELVPRGTTV